jgi:hypothetical protein
VVIVDVDEELSTIAPSLSTDVVDDASVTDELLLVAVVVVVVVDTITIPPSQPASTSTLRSSGLHPPLTPVGAESL